MRKTIPFLIFLSCLTRPQLASSEQQNEPKTQTKVLDTQDILRSLPLEKKVGQMFIFGFNGTNIRGQAAELIRDLAPGGLVIFGRNIKSASQILHFNREAQRLSQQHSKVPLFLAVDQEGGTVTRIKVNPPLPSGLEIGATSDNNLAGRIGQQTGRLLSLLGFNMNLAPVLDLGDPSGEGFLGTRTFGHDPEYVARITNAYVEGLLVEKVIPTAKHFPGHGSVLEDSHTSLPKSTISREDLIKSHLRPYFTLAKNHGSTSAVMVAHILYSQIDPEHPATFSRTIIDGILRQEVGYQGLVITDDIQMAGAAVKLANVGERAIAAIEAGVDMLMLAFGKKAQSDAVQAVIQAVRSKRISEERIDQSVRRILNTKQHVAQLRATPPTRQELQLALSSQEMQSAAFLIFKKNFSRAISSAHTPKFAGKKPGKLLVFSGSGAFHKGIAQSTRALAVRHFPFSRKVDFVSLFKQDSSAIGIFHVTGKHSADVANALPVELRQRVILVNSETPGLIQQPEKFATVYNLLSRHPQSGTYIGQHIQALLMGDQENSASRLPSGEAGSLTESSPTQKDSFDN